MFDIINSHELASLIETYGYAAILIVVALESMGLPLPGEAALIAASLYAGTTHHLTIALVIGSAAAGAILGDNLGYALGRVGGYRLLHRYGKFIRLDADTLRASQHVFDRHGGKVVFFGRFVAFLRMWAAFLAGAHRLPWKRFLSLNAASGLVWATVMGLGSYVLGGAALRAAGILGMVGLGATGLISLMVFLALQQRAVRSERDITEKAA